MAHMSPIVLILGHSLVRRLCHDLETGFDQWADVNCNQLEGTAVFFMHSVGGRKEPKFRMFDLHVVKRLSLDIIILETRTNDFTCTGPEVVGSEIDDFVFFWIISPPARSAFVMSYLVFFHVSPLILQIGRASCRERV
mgnify:CR=1 FL=1